jgi:hypothetical protein
MGNFTNLIAQKLGVGVDDIPAVVDRYTVSGGLMRISTPDLNTFNRLFTVAPNKGVGNGEVALYWLYNWQTKPSNPLRPGKAYENRGENQPDLVINNRKVEVKATKSHSTIDLGRFGEYKDFLNMVSLVMSVYNFIEGDQNKRISINQLDYNALVEAAEAFCEFRQLLMGSKRLQEYRIFKKALKSMQEFDQTASRAGISEICYQGQNKRAGGEKIAGEISKYILTEMLGNKPGNRGYLCNVFKVGSGSNIRYDNQQGIMFHYIDLDKMKTDPQTLSGSGRGNPKGFNFAGGRLTLNFTKLFS